jgi:hypothetical protein
VRSRAGEEVATVTAVFAASTALVRAGYPVPVRRARFGRAPGGRPDPELQLLWAERLTTDPIARAGQGNSFSDMCEHLVAELRATGPLDLLVLAHVTPDLDSRDSVAGALASPELLVLAVSDQGRLAPFTALRVAAAFPDRPHAAVIVLDQAAVPYADSDLSALDDRADHAVALLPALGFDPVRQWAGVTGDRVASLLDEALRAEQPDLVILGPALPPPAGFAWRRAPGDQLATAVFSALSAEMADGAGTVDRTRRITVVEYEPAIRGLALVTWSEHSRPARHLTPVPEIHPDRSHRR